MADLNRLKKHVKRSRKIALKPTLKGKKNINNSEQHRSADKPSYHDILEKFTQKLTIK